MKLGAAGYLKHHWKYLQSFIISVRDKSIFLPILNLSSIYVTSIQVNIFEILLFTSNSRCSYRKTSEIMSYTGCSNTIYPFLISNFDTVNIILSIWEFKLFLYMLLGVLSQNFIGIGWKMSDLRIIIFTWVIFNRAGVLCKKTCYFCKIYKILIIEKSPNLAKNCVE